MSSIQVITGSSAGTKITGNFGSIYAITDSQITVTGSGFENRFNLPKGENFTDTGTWNTNNSFTEIIAWTKANIVVQSA
jgi:hypothetical protein